MKNTYVKMLILLALPFAHEQLKAAASTSHSDRQIQERRLNLPCIPELGDEAQQTHLTAYQEAYNRFRSEKQLIITMLNKNDIEANAELITLLGHMVRPKVTFVPDMIRQEETRIETFPKEHILTAYNTAPSLIKALANKPNPFTRTAPKVIEAIFTRISRQTCEITGLLKRRTFLQKSINVSNLLRAEFNEAVAEAAILGQAHSEHEILKHSIPKGETIATLEGYKNMHIKSMKFNIGRHQRYDIFSRVNRRPTAPIDKAVYDLVASDLRDDYQLKNDELEELQNIEDAILLKQDNLLGDIQTFCPREMNSALETIRDALVPIQEQPIQEEPSLEQPAPPAPATSIDNRVAWATGITTLAALAVSTWALLRK